MYSINIDIALHKGDVSLKTYDVIVIRQAVASIRKYRGVDKSLDRPGGKQTTATENSELHITYF
jgi:hypothetical protein